MTSNLLVNASGFEILFLASALIGAWSSRLNLREAYHDWHALGGLRNGRRAIAGSTIITEAILLSIHALYIIAGTVAVFMPSSGNVSAVGLLILSILVYASWAVTAISLTSRRLRRYLNEHGMQSRDELGRFTKDD